MFCYTVASNIQCVLRELELWTEISKEHPIFIITVAKLTNKNLSKPLIEKLENVQKDFESVHRRVTTLNHGMGYGDMGWAMYPYMTQVINLIDEFLKYDYEFVQVLNEVKSYGKEDKVWQQLIEHIMHEQKYMYRLFWSLRNQLYMRP